MHIQSVDRALDILSLFSATRPRLGITEMSRLQGLPKPTVHGLVRTLVKRGFLTQDPETRKYSLGLKIYELGIMLCGALKVNQLGSGPADRLVKRFELTARIAMWDQNSVLVTATLYPHWQRVPFQQLGPRVPAYCTAIGKAILAYLPAQELKTYLRENHFHPYTTNTLTTRKTLAEDLRQTRIRGYSVDREEFMMGLACIGVPIFDHTGRPAGSLSLSGEAGLLARKDFGQMTQELTQTASEISGYMGYQPGAYTLQTRAVSE